MAVRPPPRPLAPPPRPRAGTRERLTPGRPPDSTPYAAGAALVAIVLVLVAIAAAGTRGLGDYRDESAPVRTLLIRGGLGAGIAAAAAAIGFALVARTRRGERRTMLAAALPWLVGLIALGAVLGIATTSLGAKDSSPPPSSRGEDAGPQGLAPRGRLTQGTGARASDPSLDSTGRPLNQQLPRFDAAVEPGATPGAPPIAIDSDGNGRLDAPLGRCPRNDANTPGTSAARPGSVIIVPVDFECDGKIDAYARVRADDLAARKAAPPQTHNGLPVYDAELGEGSASGADSVEVDRNGDGKVDSPLVPCAKATAQSTPQRDANGKMLVPVDYNCDGRLDAYARVDDTATSVPGSTRSRTPRTTGPADEPSPADKPSSRDWPLWLIVVLLSVAGAVLTFVAYLLGRSLLQRDRPVDEPAPDEPAIDPALAFHAALATPESTDPRITIINTYAQLLAGLEQAGLPRHPAEAPGEYLHRCLTRLAISPVPLAQLTELFAVARFSQHPLTGAHVAAAQRALHDALGELRRAEAVAPV